MMDYSIAVVLSNVKIKETVEKVLYDLNYNYPVFHSALDEALVVVRNLISKGTKIVISMGLTAEYIKKHEKIIVLELPYTTFEAYAAVKEGLKYSDKVVALGSQSLIGTIRKTINNIENHVEMCEIDDEKSVEYHAKKFIEKGFKVIISGSPSVDIAKDYGIIGINPGIDEKAVLMVMDIAQYILRFVNQAEANARIVQAILDCAQYGIIVTDNSGVITYVNDAAQNITGLSMQEISVKPLRLLVDENKVIDLSNGEKYDFVNAAEDRKVSISSNPILVCDKIEGMIYKLKEVSEAHQAEQKACSKVSLKQHPAKNSFDDIIGVSPAILKAKKKALKFSGYDSTVLITGETGTGKEIFAQSIHNASKRKDGPFVAVNCAAMPESLLESELFGYVRGAFTGARHSGKVGLFEIANKGTIFLDEISEISISMQARLLRVLQEKEIIRIGDDSVINVDVRVLASSNKNLFELVQKGKFREDLYYRLCVLELKLPPLRERKEDIERLVESIIHEKNCKLGKFIKGFTPELIRAFERMEWKGNIRQLQNLIERMIVLAEDDYLDISMLKEVEPYLVEKEDEVPMISGKLKNIELRLIEDALEYTKGNKKEAADLLGINVTTLWRKLKKFEKNSEGIESI